MIFKALKPIIFKAIPGLQFILFSPNLRFFKAPRRPCHPLSQNLNWLPHTKYRCMQLSKPDPHTGDGDSYISNNQPNHYSISPCYSLRIAHFMTALCFHGCSYSPFNKDFPFKNIREELWIFNFITTLYSTTSNLVAMKGE